jgi:phosphoribosyl 1,2-cyclic phosphodiesterase
VAEDEFSVRFWGVRGSIACPGPARQRYGGNTSCLEVRCGAHRLILDGGTGLRELGQGMETEGTPVEFDILFSHTHVDHIVGLPFFQPLFNPDNRVRMWAGHLRAERSLEEVLRLMMQPPLWPVPMEVFAANVAYRDFACGEELFINPGVRVRTAPLNHPNGATGYRIEYDGRSICYVTDTEHVPGKPDRRVLELIAGADIVIYDATYTDAEFPRFQGWGHSTWQEGARLCLEAGVKTYVAFHHNPSHDDAFLDQVAAEAKEMHSGAVVAREGVVLTP